MSCVLSQLVAADAGDEKVLCLRQPWLHSLGLKSELVRPWDEAVGFKKGWELPDAQPEETRS